MTSTRVLLHSTWPPTGERLGISVDTQFGETVGWGIDRPPTSRIAFGDRTAAEIVVHADDPALTRWFAAVALGGRGRYGAAFSLLDQLVRSPMAPDAVRAHAAVTRASHLRQLGGHLWARRWDGLGLSLAGAPEAGPGARSGPMSELGTDAAAARIDALLGLAADALGLGDLELSARLLAHAEPAARVHLSWRPMVRLQWITAELALARDQPMQAVAQAGQALAASRAAGATRHEIKSQLVLTIARFCAGEPVSKVRATLESLSERASASRVYSLEWPIQLVLSRMIGAETTPPGARYDKLLAQVRAGSDPFGRMVLDRSPWVLEDQVA